MISKMFSKEKPEGEEETLYQIQHIGNIGVICDDLSCEDPAAEESSGVLRKL